MGGDVDQLLDVLLDIRSQGVTVLLVEQDVHSAFQIADRGHVLDGQDSARTAKELAENPQVRRAYLGL